LVLIELKAVSKLRKLHERQVVSYLKATGLRLGLLMNFNTAVLKQGIRRIIL
jgi:GxxExxY protein